ATTSQLYTLSLHDALPILGRRVQSRLPEEAWRGVADLRAAAEHRMAGRRVRAGDDQRVRVAGAEQAGEAEPPADLVDQRPLLVRSEEHTSELQSRFDLVCR